MCKKKKIDLKRSSLKSFTFILLWKSLAEVRGSVFDADVTRVCYYVAPGEQWRLLSSRCRCFSSARLSERHADPDVIVPPGSVRGVTGLHHGVEELHRPAQTDRRRCFPELCEGRQVSQPRRREAAGSGWQTDGAPLLGVSSVSSQGQLFITGS